MRHRLPSRNPDGRRLISLLGGLAMAGFTSGAVAFGGAPADTCSPYIGDATLNEVHDLGDDQWVEVRLLDEEIEPDIWEGWTVVTSTGPGAGNEDQYDLGNATANESWLLLDVDKQALDLKNNGETEVALLDSNGEYIDYLSINGAEHNEPGNCDDFLYDTDAVSGSQYKSVMRIPDGVGDWMSPSAPGAGGGTTPGGSNDGGGGTQTVDANSREYEGDDAALYTRIVGSEFDLTVRYRADEPEPQEVTLDLVEGDGNGGCGGDLAADWGSTDEFEGHEDGGYEATLSGLSHDEAVSRARIRIELVVKTGGNPGGGGNAGPGCGFFPFLPWCNSGGGGGANPGGGGQETTLEYCSSDAFTIRPAGLEVTARNDAGQELTGNNSDTCDGEPCQTAGDGFQLEVSTEGEVTGYRAAVDLTFEPTVSPDDLQPDTLSPQSLSFTKDAAAVSTDTARYDEVGVPAVIASDGGDFAKRSGDRGDGHCRTEKADNDLEGGLVGCQTQGSKTVGRFIPDHFAVVDDEDTGVRDRFALLEEGCLSDDFTYLGETLAADITLEAQNAADDVTANYRGSLARLGTSGFGNWAVFLADGATLDSDRLEAGGGSPEVRSGWGVDEAGRAAFRFPRVVTRGDELNGPYEGAEFAFIAEDEDGVRTVEATGLDGRASSGTTDLRYGRLAIESMTAAAFAEVDLPLRAEYWDGDEFLTNGRDDCTPLELRYRSLPRGSDPEDVDWEQQPALGGPMLREELPASLEAGEVAIPFSAPDARGEVAVCANLEDHAYLHRGANEDLPEVCQGSPRGSVWYGISSGNENVLFTREVFD